MPPSSNQTPPLSPVLLAGFALRPVPPIFFQPFLDAGMALMSKRHPGVFERISSYGSPVYLIDPLDLPYTFLLHSDPHSPRLIARQPEYSGQVDATIRGPLTCLLAMLEGRIDGDALFFSRDIQIDGDTEAVVALRNAIDDAEIGLKDDFLSLFGKFSRPAKSLVGAAERLAGLAARDLETLRQAVIAPSMRRHETQETRLSGLSDRLDAAEGRARKTRGSRA